MVQALCYLVGFAMLATVMNPGDTEGWSSAEKLSFILERSALFQAWNLLIYVVFGVALVVLTSMLHRLLARPERGLWSVATPFGFIWAGLVIASGMVANIGVMTVQSLHESSVVEAVQLWSTIGVIQDGLGGGVEVVGGVWVLLVSAASLRERGPLPAPLNWLGVVVGLTGILTVVPALKAFGVLFGLTQIGWFLWLAVVLWRANWPEPGLDR